MWEVTKLSDTTIDGIRCTLFATCGVTCSTQINLQTEGDTIRREEIVARLFKMYQKLTQN